MTSGLEPPWRSSGQGCHSKPCLPIRFPKSCLSFSGLQTLNNRSQAFQWPQWWLSSLLPTLQSWFWGRIPAHLPIFQKLTSQRLPEAKCLSQRGKKKSAQDFLFLSLAQPNENLSKKQLLIFSWSLLMRESSHPWEGPTNGHEKKCHREGVWLSLMKW